MYKPNNSIDEECGLSCFHSLHKNFKMQTSIALYTYILLNVDESWKIVINSKLEFHLQYD